MTDKIESISEFWMRRCKELEADLKQSREYHVAAVCKECKCKNRIEHNETIAKKNRRLEAENEKLIERLEKAERYLNLAYVNNKAVDGILTEYERHHKEINEARKK